MILSIIIVSTIYSDFPELNIKDSKMCIQEKTDHFRGSPIRIAADFSSDTLLGSREWKDIIQVLKERNC